MKEFVHISNPIQLRKVKKNIFLNLYTAISVGILLLWGLSSKLKKNVPKSKLIESYLKLQHNLLLNRLAAFQEQANFTFLRLHTSHLRVFVLF